MIPAKKHIFGLEFTGFMCESEEEYRSKLQQGWSDGGKWFVYKPKEHKSQIEIKEEETAEHIAVTDDVQIETLRKKKREKRGEE